MKNLLFGTNNLLLSTGVLIAIIAVAVLLVIVIAIVCWGIGARNSLVRLKNKMEEAFSTIDVYLKKRYDMIPNLVEIVKGYAKHESQTLENVIKARNNAVNANTTAEKIDADAQLTNAIKSLNFVVEAYPDLKANASFLSLSSDLKGIEVQLAEQRKYYNAVVRTYNTAREVFPKSVIANMMHLEKAIYFQLDSDEERQNVKIQF